MELWLVIGVSCLALVAAAVLAPRDRSGSASRNGSPSPRLGGALVVRAGLAGAVLLVVHDAQRPGQGALACLAFALGVAAAACSTTVGSFLSRRPGPRARLSAAAGLSGMAFVLSGAALACLGALVLGPALGLPTFGVLGPAVIPAFALGTCLAGGSDVVAAMALESAGALVAAGLVYEANWDRFGVDAGPAALGLLAFPLVVRALGIVASWVGLVLPKALWIAVGLAAAGVVGASYWSLGPYWPPFALAGATGAVVAGGVTHLARASGREPGAAWLALLAIAVATVTSYELGEGAGLASGGFFGAACASSGALGLSGYALGIGAALGDEPTHEADGYAAVASVFASITGLSAWIGLSTAERAARWADHAQLPKRSIGELFAQYLARAASEWTVRPDATLCGMLAGAAIVLWARAGTRAPHPRWLALALLVALGVTFRFMADAGATAVGAVIAGAAIVAVVFGVGLASSEDADMARARKVAMLLAAAALAVAPLLA